MTKGLQILKSGDPQAQKLIGIAKTITDVMQMCCQQEGITVDHAPTILASALGVTMSARYNMEIEAGAEVADAKESLHNSLAASIRTALGLLRAAGHTIQFAPNELIPLEGGTH